MEAKLGNLIVVLNYGLKFAANLYKFCQLGFSSKIEMPQLGSAQLGKFQLELITTNYLQYNLDGSGLQFMIYLHTK